MTPQAYKDEVQPAEKAPAGIAHGLRNELYFCAQVAPQAGSALVFLRTKNWKYPYLKEAGESKRMLSSQMIAEIHFVAQSVGKRHLSRGHHHCTGIFREKRMIFSKSSANVP